MFCVFFDVEFGSKNYFPASKYIYFVFSKESLNLFDGSFFSISSWETGEIWTFFSLINIFSPGSRMVHLCKWVLVGKLGMCPFGRYLLRHAPCGDMADGADARRFHPRFSPPSEKYNVTP